MTIRRRIARLVARLLLPVLAEIDWRPGHAVKATVLTPDWANSVSSELTEFPLRGWEGKDGWRKRIEAARTAGFNAAAATPEPVRRAILAELDRLVETGASFEEAKAALEQCLDRVLPTPKAIQ